MFRQLSAVRRLPLICLAFFPAILAADTVDYKKQVQPILRERCFACHGALKQEASLRLDSASLIKKGGDSGSAIDLDEPNASEILNRVEDPDPDVRMPPEGKPLTEKEIHLLRLWIQQGAPAPQDDRPEEPPQAHWAFQVPIKVDIDESRGNPIDQILDRVRHEAGIRYSMPEAEPGVLLRRVYLDLIGLPPDLKTLSEFESNASANKYDKIIDQLLASKHHGERWGRHWMDVWRYSDWYGLGAQLRYSQKHIWHWRDWIIESLNQDKGYDQMVREMLAADELYPTDRDRLRGTGFLARNYYLFNRTTWLDSTIEHTSKAFLGLTMNCAKCHDHKYDPITQQDYYRLRAIFEPHQVRLDPVPGNTDLEMDGIPRVFDAHPDLKTFVHVRGDEKQPDREHPVQAGIPGFFAEFKFRPNRVDLPLLAYRPSLQSFVLKDRLRQLDGTRQELVRRQRELENAIASARTKSVSIKPGIGTVKLEDLQGQSFLQDDFQRLDPAKWKIVNGSWKIRNGRLVQSSIGAVSHVLESCKDHPEDFVLETVLSVRGGQVWKSFGVRFDVEGAGDDSDKTVYLSAHQASKVQVSYSSQGKRSYPSSAMASIPVKENQQYNLRIAVKGPLINVAVDGKRLIAYKFPVSRKRGKVHLLSFDSIAEFDSIVVKPFTGEIRLDEPGEQQVDSVEVLTLKLDLLRAQLNEAECKTKQLESAFAADTARYESAPDLSERLHEAGKAQVGLDLAGQRVRHAELRLRAFQARKKDKPGLNKELAACVQRIKELESKSRTPATQYKPIRASQKALEGPDEKPDSRTSPYPSFSTGRRTELAEWIVNNKNPLTARVAVNQIWMRHFGRPLVEPVTDFGRRTPEPRLRELLDWLAVELMENGWKMKPIHRLIVTSKTYRMSPLANSAENRTIDPDNRFYWYRSPIRMESQVIRDSLLFLSGQLDVTMGGPPVDPNKPSVRRSLYFRQSRDHQHRFVSMFDDADILRCYRRQESIIPQQALAMANSRIVFECAQKLYSRLQGHRLNDDDFVERAFQLLLGQHPAAKEKQALLDALTKWKVSNPKGGADRSRILLLIALLNSNEFITVR